MWSVGYKWAALLFPCAAAPGGAGAARGGGEGGKWGLVDVASLLTFGSSGTSPLEAIST